MNYADEINSLRNRIAEIKKFASKEWVASKTEAAWSRLIGPDGDFADWATMIVSMPDLIGHGVTITIKKGTTLTEVCNIENKHGLNSDAFIKVQAEKYFPTSGNIPTATGGDATHLIDAGQSWVPDEFIDCWAFIVDGTGTNNGYVKITGNDATSLTVAGWTTQPDNTSRYIIVGALIDCGGTTYYGFNVFGNTCIIELWGIGVDDADLYGINIRNCFRIGNIRYCGIYGSDRAGIFSETTFYLRLNQSGIVNNNTDNEATMGGIVVNGAQYAVIRRSGISDNNQRGIYIARMSFASVDDNFGDNNGDWGTYAEDGGQARMSGVECSGGLGNHSDPGTAGAASSDQAVAY